MGVREHAKHATREKEKTRGQRRVERERTHGEREGSQKLQHEHNVTNSTSNDSCSWIDWTGWDTEAGWDEIVGKFSQCHKTRLDLL